MEILTQEILEIMGMGNLFLASAFLVRFTDGLLCDFFSAFGTFFGAFFGEIFIIHLRAKRVGRLQI